MAVIKLALPDARMLQLMDWAIKNDIAVSEGAYWDAIGFNRNSITNVRAGKQGFTRDQMIKACRLTRADANWLFGFEAQMFRNDEEQSPVELLRRVTADIEQRLGIKPQGTANKIANTRPAKMVKTSKLKK